MPQTYLVAGASAGIGSAIAACLTEQGANVIALNRNEGELANNPNITFYPCDFTDRSVELPKMSGPINGLAYLPGTINLKPFQNLTEDDYRTDWEVNFLGATRLINHCLPNLKEANLSSIVLMSTVAVQQGMSYHASIASAKGAIEGLTRSLAAEFAPKIRVNAVAPSLTATGLAEHLIKDEKRKEQAGNRHPMQRIGAPQDIAEAVVYLLSEKSSWTTGQILHVDGGLSSIQLL